MPGVPVVCIPSISDREANKLSRYVQKEILRQMKEKVDANHSLIKDKIYDQLQFIWQSPEVIDLVDGGLAYDLGVLDREVDSAIHGLIDVIMNDVVIDVRVGTNFLQVIISIIKNDYTDILQVPGASFVQTFHLRLGQDYVIPWLEWLLLRGNDIVVADYHVVYDIKPGEVSRTGGAIMSRGGDFQILPLAFTGTADDNFITRSLSRFDDAMYSVLAKILEN